LKWPGSADIIGIMKESVLFERLKEKKIRCLACAHGCVIKPGRRGKCRVRENVDGTLMSLVFGKVVSMSVDPIEKKPLFHFLPGSRSLSMATVGCNLRCRHCQNYEISQFPRLRPDSGIPGEDMTPAQIVDNAAEARCESISYTYTEPTIFLEFAYETAVLARDRGIRNVFVSNGFMTSRSARLIAPLLDGNNIDLKGDDEFYRDICGARLEPVQDTIALMKESGVWVEVTTLIIPGLNDSEKTLGEIAGFIAGIDPGIPWHVSRFHPTYKMLDRPSTPVESLRRAVRIGGEVGLKYVYEGNVPGGGGENTLCPACGSLLISRVGFRVEQNMLRKGSCPNCGSLQAGVWK
jgi:pyruvate formate lyase activating enzyme